MSAVYLILGAVVLARLAELVFARRNTARLKAQGATEHGAWQHPLFVLLHASWLAALILTVPPDQPVRWFWLGVFALLQGLRVWTLASLGSRWTTRVIVLPGAPLVRRGPYRFLAHPNYVVVTLEIATLPLVFDALVIALVFSVLNAVLLVLRIRVEERALRGAVPHAEP